MEPSASTLAGPVSITEAERRELVRRWEGGLLLRLVDQLVAFAGRHREEILRLAGGDADARAVLQAMKQLILQHGSVDAAAELADQRQEMQDECWFRGEKGERNRGRVLAEWTERYAAAWRAWRLKEYLFVTDRCADLILPRLLSHHEGGAGGA